MRAHPGATCSAQREGYDEQHNFARVARRASRQTSLGPGAGGPIGWLIVSAMLAFAASVLWGCSDFLAGHRSKALAPETVVRWSQGLGLIMLSVPVVVLLWLDPAAFRPGAWMGWSVLAGFGGATALWCLYAALATGTMGVVAPIAGAGALVTVALGILVGEQPSVMAWVGMGLALVGAALASGPEVRAGESVRPILLAIGAAFGFGIVFFALDRGSREALLPTIWLERLVIVLLYLALWLRSRGSGARALLSRRNIAWLTLIGIADLAGNSLYAMASSSGLVSVASVLASIYPVWTALLAAALLHERLRLVQILGVVVTMAGVGAIALG